MRVASINLLDIIALEDSKIYYLRIQQLLSRNTTLRHLALPLVGNQTTSMVREHIRNVIESLKLSNTLLTFNLGVYLDDIKKANFDFIEINSKMYPQLTLSPVVFHT